MQMPLHKVGIGPASRRFIKKKKTCQKPKRRLGLQQQLSGLPKSNQVAFLNKAERW